MTISAPILAALLVLAAPREVKPVQASCDRVKALAIPASDRGDAAALKGCDSEALYYGIGVPADPVAAKQCAILEVESDAGKVFGGEAILMMVYANGRGASRNLDLALEFACAVGGAPAELEGRVSYLESQKIDGTNADGSYDLCDHVTSGFMQGHCAAHDARIAAAGRDVDLGTLMSRWKPGDKDAYQALRKAADAWIKARSRDEVDLSGTARGAMVAEEEEAQEKSFQAFLTKLETNPASVSGTKADLAAADKKLNATYRALQALPELGWGTVEMSGIKTTERAWIAYRDAWIAFAKKKYPKVSSDAISAELTAERERMLAGFLPE